MTYTLYYAPDNASLIVRLALDELGLAYDTVLVDRRVKDQKSATYLAMNPAGRIPVLVTDHGPMFETAAILMWLVDRHDGLGPRPTDAARPRFLSWLFYVANTLHPDLIALFYPDRYGRPDSDVASHTRDRVDHALRLLNDHHNEWCAPAQDTNIIELYVAVCVRWCQLYPIGGCKWFDLTTYPALQDMAQRLEQRPATGRAIQAEGLHTTPFSAARYATPPKGSAL